MRLVAVVLAACLLAGCARSGPSFNNSDITGADWGRGFTLTDHAGQPRSLADFRGKVVVLFFGYVFCPDVCPTTLAEFKGVLEQLGQDAKRVQVLFVTVDPNRDTATVLRQYVTAFHPDFLGLRGTEDQLARTAKEFKVYYQKVPGAKPDSYTVDHTAGSYVFDPNGRIRLFVSYGQVRGLAEDIRTLLRGS